MPDSTAISRALLTYLQSDAALAALLPDGIYGGMAPPGAQLFGLVQYFDGDDHAVFGGRAIEVERFAVKAVMLTSASGDLSAAADRIDVLLSEAQFPVAGYVLAACYREPGRPVISYDDPEGVDAALRYRHLGGHYTIACSVPGPIRKNRPAE